MTLQQLEYIVAVDSERHFVKAAETCFVTQATLSMMIKKLEQELELQIFDRSTYPVTVTTEGKEIIARARKITADAAQLRDYAREIKGEVRGEVRMGILPTLAPYLLPLFIKSFIQKFPDVRIRVRELITPEIIDGLINNHLDVGILATPLNESRLTEYPVFYEEFLAYASGEGMLPAKKYLLPKDIDPTDLWLLEEGHCLRGQLVNLCALKGREDAHAALQYEAGSLESLINLVDRYGGVTILPKLATLRLSARQQKCLRPFASPTPTREVSLVALNTFPRKQLIKELQTQITGSVKPYTVTGDIKIKVVDL